MKRDEIAPYDGRRVIVTITDGQNYMGRLQFDANQNFVRLLPSSGVEPVGFVEPTTIPIKDIAGIADASGVTFTRNLTIDALCTFQQPILEAVTAKFSGASADYAPLPNGAVALVVVWDGFLLQDEEQRKNAVLHSIDNVGRGASARISAIIAMTRDEMEKHERGAPEEL